MFFDKQCSFCNRAVGFILSKDKKKDFLFAPLEGITAQKFALSTKSLVLIENYTTHPNIIVEGKAVLRILWHLGGLYALIGVLSFLPSFLFDRVYRWIAQHRLGFFSSSALLAEKDFSDRLLP